MNYLKVTYMNISSIVNFRIFKRGVIFYRYRITRRPVRCCEHMLAIYRCSTLWRGVWTVIIKSSHQNRRDRMLCTSVHSSHIYMIHSWLLLSEELFRYSWISIYRISFVQGNWERKYLCRMTRYMSGSSHGIDQ